MKVIDAEYPIVFFWGGGGQLVVYQMDWHISTMKVSWVSFRIIGSLLFLCALYEVFIPIITKSKAHP